MIIEERINIYKQNREIEISILDERKSEIAESLKRACDVCDNRDFKQHLSNALAEVSSRMDRISQYDLLIRALESLISDNK